MVKMDKTSKLTQSGGKTNENGRLINEDKLIEFKTEQDGKITNFIILMDGASGLGKNNHIIPGYTSAEWYVNFMASKFQESFEENPTKPIQDVVEECIEEAIKRIEKFENETGIKLTEYEKPSASLAIQRDDGDNIEIFLLGDTDTIIEYKDGNVVHVDNPNQNAVQSNDGQALKKMKELEKERGLAIEKTISEPEVMKILQDNRAKKNRNCEGGYWILGTTPGATEHGVYLTVPKDQIKSILLASDGFNREIIGKDEKEILKLLDGIGVEAVVRMIIEAENNDPKFDKSPRFKMHDDNTVAYKQIRVKEFNDLNVEK